MPCPCSARIIFHWSLSPSKTVTNSIIVNHCLPFPTLISPASDKELAAQINYPLLVGICKWAWGLTTCLSVVNWAERWVNGAGKGWRGLGFSALFVVVVTKGNTPEWTPAMTQWPLGPPHCPLSRPPFPQEFVSFTLTICWGLGVSIGSPSGLSFKGGLEVLSSGLSVTATRQEGVRWQCYVHIHVQLWSHAIRCVFSIDMGRLW